MNYGNMISFVANAVFICWFTIVLYWSWKLITNNDKYNEYNYNSAAIKFQCIFAWLLFTVMKQNYKNKFDNQNRSQLVKVQVNKICKYCKFIFIINYATFALLKKPLTLCCSSQIQIILWKWTLQSYTYNLIYRIGLSKQTIRCKFIEYFLLSLFFCSSTINYNKKFYFCDIYHTRILGQPPT